MNKIVRYVGSAVVASILAVVLTLYVFQLPVDAAINTGLMAAAIAVIIVYMNERQSEAGTDRPHERS